MDGPEPPSPSQPPAPRFYMHPLLSHTQLYPAPISYNIVFSPCTGTVFDRTVDSPIPAVTLSEPATEPPIPASSRLILRASELPWLVIVTGSKEGKKGGVETSSVLTNLDVLYAVHKTLLARAAPEEWDALGEGSHAQCRVSEAYEDRCTRIGGGWEGGVRRVDWLGPDTHLVGVEIDENDEASEITGRLVFGPSC